MITGQCNVCDIRKKVFTNFHNTVTDRLVDIFFVYASFNSLFIFSLFSFFLLLYVVLRCIILCCTA